MDPRPPEPAERIIQAVERLISMPRLSDPDQNRIAGMVHILSTIILATGIAVICITPFIFTNPVYGLIITGTSLLFISLVQVLNRRGRARLASRLFVYTLWVVITVIILFSGGFSSIYLLGYTTVTVVGGLVLGGFTAYHLAGLSITTSLLFFYLETQGLMPEPVLEFTPVAMIIIMAVSIFLAAAAVVVLLTRYEKNFRQLIDKEHSLSLTNLELSEQIQARETAEGQLRQTEQQFRTALMECPFPALLHTEDGQIMLANTAWIGKSGYSPREVDSLDQWLEHIFRENAPQVRDEIASLLRSPASRREGNYSLYTQKGDSRIWNMRWTRLPDLPDGRKLVLTMATDMTDLLSVETALRESEQHLSKFSLVTNDGIWDWDLETDSVVFDPRYYTMAGYEVNEFPHQLEEFRKRVHPDDVEQVFKQAEDLIAGRSDDFSVEFRFQKKTGGWLWVLGRGKIIEQDQFGNPLRFVGTHTDISHLKRVQDELNLHQQQLEDTVEERTKRLNERVSEVERLNAALTNILDDYQITNQKLSSLSTSLSSTYQELESFTYAISNDIREPLNAVRDSSALLGKHYLDHLDDRGRKILADLETSADLVDRQISELIKLSRLGRQQLDLQTLDPGELLVEVLDEFSQEIKDRKIQISIKNLPACLADKNMIKLVFSHLISNSVKFTRDEEKPRITVGYQPDQTGDRVVYYVRDNGIGFDMADQDRVFERFQQLGVQEGHNGPGIGLALAKKAVQRHGGEIWTEARQQEGATFYFDLARPPGS